jgi:hypothetical protein
MNHQTYFKIKYSNETFDIVKGGNMLEVIRRHNLETKEHIETRIFELEGEQLAIARANDEDNT